MTENARVEDAVAVLTTKGPGALGSLLNQSHASMRDDFEISSPELDLAVDTALSAGAVGSRMTGGGFGGAAIALVQTSDVDAVTEAVTSAFASAGFASPGIFSVMPAAGARRIS